MYDSAWWYHFNYAMDTYGYHHWEAEIYANHKTGCLPPVIEMKELPSIAESCYVPKEVVFPPTKKE